jgi:hypothetical protein
VVADVMLGTLDLLVLKAGSGGGSSGGGELMRGDRKSEIDAELALHFEMQTEHQVRSGRSPSEPRHRALVDFIGPERFREVARDGYPPATQVAAAALIHVAAFFAAAVPALRALRIPPGEVLRAE